jgi:hypothetical protein
VSIVAVVAILGPQRRQSYGPRGLPWVLGRKYPNAGREWGWQWAFPATRFYIDRVAGHRRRHHLHESVLQRAVKEPSSRPAWPSEPLVTLCGTPSRRISSKTATTFALSRDRSDTVT